VFTVYLQYLITAILTGATHVIIFMMSTQMTINWPYKHSSVALRHRLAKKNSRNYVA